MSESDDNIIELYRKALEAKKNNKKELIEKVELLKQNVNTEDFKSNDPLEIFLFKLNDILKENKKNKDPSLIEQIIETNKDDKKESDKDTIEEFYPIEESDKNIIEESDKNIIEESDPLEKFLFKLNDVLVSSKEEKVKNSALDLIEQLKNEPVEIKEKKIVEDVPIPPQPELGQVPNVTPPLDVINKLSKPLPKKKDNYVKELESADKEFEKNNKETDQQKSIKEEVQKQVKEILVKYRNGVVAEGGGGDGNFSTEFKNGGTMYGSLNVTGQYLSGGVPLTDIFGSVGGGSSDRLIAGLQELILKSDGTITFPDDTIRTTDGKLLSIEAETLALSAFTKIALSGNAFYAYDSNGNAITFDTTDNEIVLTTQGTNSWTFRDNGDLALPRAIVTASNSKLDLVGFGPNTAYLTTTPDDTTALFMGADVAELRAKTYASIATNTSDTTHLWEFGADGSLKFPDNTTQTTAFTGNPDSSNWDSTYTTVQANSGNWATEEFALAMSIGLS